ncbi:MAG: GAF domain-containing protein [Armatimonadetes bacterium]|nr:MAG: GAF domain-containing protein [Armatimonadota bacterium]
MIDYRIRVVHTGLIVSWLALLSLGLWALGLTTDDQGRILMAFGGFVIALILLTIVPWRTTLGTPIADWLIAIWCVAALLAQLAIELRVSHIPTAVGFLMVPFFAAATAIAVQPALAVGVAAVASYWVALGESTGYVTAASSTALLAFVGATVFVMLISVRIRSQIQESSTRYEELAARESKLVDQEQELSKLYDVSLAIGAGTKLSDVLPELVGRVADSVGARIGLAMLYEPTDETLGLMSPIWVSGHTVPADDLILTLDEPGLSQSVFMSGDAATINSMDLVHESDRLAAELQAERIAAVSLRIEDRIIGVLLVGDKKTDFTDEDLRTLEAVAAPAALVLNQLTRYEQVRMSSERMAELAQMKTDFVSVVSHELRTPLTSIIGALSTLKRPELAPDDPRARQLIDMADKQSHRLRTLIEDLLVMSRLEAAALPVRPEDIDIEPFVRELLAALPDAERVDVIVDPVARRIVSDPDLFARVITNLVENALKYGGGSDVAIRTAGVRDEIRVSVIDHGPGIPYEKHDLVFERFTQLQPHATRSTGGVGLGLSIVKGLAEAMGGRVWFEPTVGGGATFTVALPSDGAAPTPASDS